ncbi:hypothetical protein Tco_1151461, partial [Tanacetum coccineum]
MFKLDLEPLSPRLLQNREVHITYLRNTQEQAKELLVYVQDTYPNAIIPSAKKVTVKPMNNVKKVRFAEPFTSSSNIKQIRERPDYRIMGYGDYQLGNVIISRVYYVEGLGHNLFSVGQFCDADLKVAFWKNTCFIRTLEGVDLLSGSRDTNLYTISLDDMLKSSLICLLSKASSGYGTVDYCMFTSVL